MTTQYGLHEATAHNLLHGDGDPWSPPNPSPKQVQHATAHFLGQLVEELQQHRADSQTAAEELVHVLDDGLNSVADAINRLADTQAASRANDVAHEVSWWSEVWSAIRGRAPRARCGELLVDDGPAAPGCAGCQRGDR